MQLQNVVNMFGGDLSRRYGEKVHKLMLHGGFSCPNRDGTVGRGGCTFCNVASFASEDQQFNSISQQLTHQILRPHRAKRYLAYFQAYTSTYAEVTVLDNLYRQALAQADIVGLCVGTRPDCVPQSVLNLLAGYRDEGYEVWLELGLQSAQDKTLHRINRGHDFACYRHTAQQARSQGLNLCTHLIAGLPGEDKQVCLDSLNRVIEAGVDGLKLHPLLIVDGSIMAKAWRAGRQTTLELAQYCDIAATLIRHTPVDIVFHRLSATAHRPMLLAPIWCADRWQALNAIYQQLLAQGGQGSAL